MINIKNALALDNSIIVDVRSEDEYADSHIYGAINIPILSNSSRKEVGIIYKEFGRTEAIKKGLDLTSPSLSLILNEFMDMPHDKNIVLYCARGGLRSRSIYNVLKTFRDNVFIIEGGYKAYRNYILSEFKHIVEKKEFYVLQGNTGVGKTIILREYKESGGSVLDLEGIARNAGSVFGSIPFDKEQPTQKQFENDLFFHLTNTSKVVFTESENRRIGRIILPEEVYNAIVHSKHVLVKTNIKNRVNNIKKDYLKYLNADDHSFKEAIARLKKMIGNEKVNELSVELDKGNIDYVIEQLMTSYYDVLYKKYVSEKYDYYTEIEYNDIDEVIQVLGEIERLNA